MITTIAGCITGIFIALLIIYRYRHYMTTTVRTPLTPEILNKYGLEKESFHVVGYLLLRLNEIDFYISNNGLYHSYCSPGPEYSTTEVAFIRELNYLDELQDVYFALTGKVLKIIKL